MTASIPVILNNITALDQAAETSADLEAILHPGKVFARPMDVVQHPALPLAEKRAILASWASDACAVEAAPALRAAPGATQPVSFDEVMDALGALDRLGGGDQALASAENSRPRLSGRRRWRRVRESGSNEGSVPLG
jgi:hypothetical protein